MYCFVGDLAGFQNIVLYLPLDQQEVRINQWIDLVKSAAQRCEISQFKLISDTIVATTDETPSGLEKLVKFSKILLEEGLDLKLPLRGAISQGEVKWTEQIVFGKAVIDAYRLASNQNWLGVTFNYNFQLPPSMWDIDKVVVYPSPLKKGKVGLLPVVSWEMPPVSALIKMTLGEGLTNPDEFVEWDYFEKMNNTAIFSLYLKSIKKIERETKKRVNISHYQGISPLEVIEHIIEGHPIDIG